METVSFTRMDQGTADEYVLLDRLEEEHKQAHLADNLLGLYALLSGKGRQVAQEECAAMGWGTFKPLLAEATVAALEPIQSRHRELMADRSELDRVLAEGRDQAEAVADATLNRVREALGFAKRG